MRRPTRLLTAALAVTLSAAVAQPLANALEGLGAHDHSTHVHAAGAHVHADGVVDHCETVADGAVVCAHADAPPAGVDVRRMPSLRELQSRGGAATTAVLAAQTTGVPTPVQYAAGSTVACDGDGRSGSRVQAMYVVAEDRPNRFAELESKIQTWAAGVEDVVNRSAAQTGGVRSVRYVTGPASGGTCTPTVLNVTVPRGANASFGSTINAVQQLGHTDPARKYLMWVDATGLCGIASTYQDDRATQDNANNGRYPQYARIDAACWGQSMSVEAHELLHNLGGVQRSAPHSTANGHCTDDADRMCYVDGPGVTLRKVCPPENEALFDCGNDDYWLAAKPALSSYLGTHWNTADSRFLVGGGGDTAGNGPPTGLSAVVAVNNPGIAGLPTQVTATTQDVPGRDATVAWTVSRKGCTFADPTAKQTTVTCSAASSAKATVTLTATNGVTTVRATSPLTFSAVARTATVTSTLTGATGSAVNACPKTVLPVSTKVVDAASGSPVWGVKVQFVQTLAGRASVLGTATTGPDGTATGKAKGVDGAAVSARLVKTGAFPSGTSEATTVNAAAPCATSVEATLAAGSLARGERAVVTGVVRRSLDGTTAVVPGAKVVLVHTPDGGAVAKVLARATAGADGTFRLTGVPRGSGTLSVQHTATPTYAASTSTPVSVTVAP